MCMLTSGFSRAWAGDKALAYDTMEEKKEAMRVAAEEAKRKELR